MFIPVIQKLKKRNDVYVERVLQNEGSVIVKPGDEVRAFDSIATYKAKTKAKKGVQLLSGVWGSVEKVKDDTSVLLKTQVIDVHFELSTGSACAGELLVFPNPVRELAQHYISKFTKNNAGKIIYIGDYVDSAMVMKASSVGVAAVIAAGADIEALNLAKQKKLGLGLLNGVGEQTTPAYIFDYLNSVNSRFVFFRGDENYLRVPMENKFSSAEVRNYPIKFLKKEMVVKIFVENYFGAVGTVDSIKGSSIFVRVSDSDELVEVEIPNLLILE